MRALLFKNIKDTTIVSLILALNISTMILPAQASTEILSSTSCPLGCPIVSDGKSMSVVVHENYISGIDHATKLSRWVAYGVDSKNIGKRPKAEFRSDPLLPKKIRLSPKSYKGLYEKYNTDRGHLAPATTIANFSGEESFYLSNIIPQFSTLNRKAWKNTEIHERKTVKKQDKPIYVITGAINKTTKNGALLPSTNFWKIIIHDVQEKQISAIIFKPGKNIKKSGNKEEILKKDNFCYKNIKLDSLEKITGLQFFSSYVVKQNNINWKGRCPMP